METQLKIFSCSKYKCQKLLRRKLYVRVTRVRHLSETSGLQWLPTNSIWHSKDGWGSPFWDTFSMSLSHSHTKLAWEEGIIIIKALFPMSLILPISNTHLPCFLTPIESYLRCLAFKKHLCGNWRGSKEGRAGHWACMQSTRFYTQ